MTATTKRFGTFLAPFGLAAWAAGAVALWVVGRQRGWSPGELVLAAAGWVIVLAVIAREPVRNLFGPVFWYEVTRVGRRYSTFVLRFLYILLVCAILTLMYLSWRSSLWRYGQLADTIEPDKLAEFAATFFNIFAVVQYGVILLITPACVAGAITDEKERKTIDYLFTTDLANREIVFGKLAARVATVTLYILAGLPVIAFLQLFGGIDPDLVLAGTAASMVTAVGLSAVAIAMSAASKRSRDAIVATYGLLVLYLVGSIVLAAIVRSASRWGTTVIDFGNWSFDFAEVTDAIAAGNAMYSLPQATQGGRVFDPTVISGLLGRYALFWGLVAVFAVAWAVTRLRRVALRQSYGTVGTKQAVVRETNRRPEIGDQPLVWREVFASDRRVGCFGWLFRIVIVGTAAVIPIWGLYEVFLRDRYWSSYRRPFTEQWEDYAEGMSAWVRISTGILTFLICMGAALRGASTVAGEKDRDTWVSLCASPVTVGEFLLAKWLGAILGMRFALWTLIGIWAVGLALGSVYWFMIPITLLFLAVFVSAFALSGIWCSISARTALVANIRAFFLAVFMSGGFWLIFLFCCVIPMAFGGGGPGRDIENLFIQPVGATPPIVTGFLPLGSFEKYDDMGPGPFHPEFTPLGPCAPFFGLGVWTVINLILMVRVREGLKKEMNRQEVLAEAPDQPPRRIPRAKPIEEVDDYSPEDPRWQS